MSESKIGIISRGDGKPSMTSKIIKELTDNMNRKEELKKAFTEVKRVVNLYNVEITDDEILDLIEKSPQLSLSACEFGIIINQVLAKDCMTSLEELGRELCFDVSHYTDIIQSDPNKKKGKKGKNIKSWEKKNFWQS